MPIVIVGSGPVGLYTAIRLAKKGFPVQVVDKYVDNFTRPGVVAIQAGEIIISELAKIGVNVKIPLANSFPETYYISDIQKTLYEEAERLGVQFIPAHFKSIKGNTVALEDIEEQIECDMLIDCTGEGRQVLNFVNTEQNKPLFRISKIADNPVKTNFVAFITMSKEDAELLKSFNGTGSPTNEVLQFEALRTQGWSQKDMPHWDMRHWKISKTQERFCCYFEMPDELARAPQRKQKEWLATLLKLKSGKDLDFELEGGSPLKFRPFSVDPHRVENPILEAGRYPFPIAACGDALMSAEYRKGTGIFNGIVCANGLINATSYLNEKYHVNTQIFSSTVTQYRPTGQFIDEHIRDIKSDYQARRNNLVDPRIQKLKLDKYLLAHELHPENEIIKKGLLHQINYFKLIADDLFTKKNYEMAYNAYEEALKACKTLEAKPSVELAEQAKLFDLKARICSNLERAYRNDKKQQKAGEYLAEGIQICKDAVILLTASEDEDIQKLRAELLAFQARLEVRQAPYLPNPHESSTITPT